ncbi:hypothetical protein BDF21DRAFT_402469 [Thamnidium elegans]|nr:hypothetical protein BDF21DRAFT_402469 [Thamnidium elegans]
MSLTCYRKGILSESVSNYGQTRVKIKIFYCLLSPTTMPLGFGPAFTFYLLLAIAHHNATRIWASIHFLVSSDLTLSMSLTCYRKGILSESVSNYGQTRVKIKIFYCLLSPTTMPLGFGPAFTF